MHLKEEKIFMTLRLIKSRGKYRCALLFAIAVLVCGCAAPGKLEDKERFPTNTAAGRHAILNTQIDRILSQGWVAGRPGVSLKIIKNDLTLYQASKGLADINENQPITQDTIFAMASITKPMTAVAIFQLLEQGRLALDDRLGKWISKLPGEWRDVTLEQLLSHQSRINFERLNVEDGMSNRDVMKAVTEQQAWWTLSKEPVGYSNGAYILLAEVIEKASGQSYSDYLQAHVFNVANMDGASVHPRPDETGRRIARNYGVSTMIYGRKDFLTGAMGVYASTVDLERFSRALLAGKLVSPDSLQRMTSDHSHAPVSRRFDSHYGYGWYVPPASQGGTIFWHSGGADGFQGLLYIDQPKGLIAILLGNGGEASVQVLNAVLAVLNKTYPD